MTPQEPAFIELSKSVKRIESALLGDELSGRKGIIHFHDKMTEDLYGIGPDGRPIEGKSNTVLTRLSKAEDSQKKVLWIFTGAIALATAIKLGFTALIDKIWK